MNYEMYEYILDNTEDKKILELGKNNFLAAKIRKSKKIGEVVKYFIFTVNKEMEILVDMTLTYNFEINQSKFIEHKNKILLYSSVFIIYKDDIIPHSLTHLYLPKFKEKLTPMLEILLSYLEKIQEEIKNNIFEINFEEDITVKTRGEISLKNSDKIKIWKEYNENFKKGYIPNIKDFK